IVVTDPVHRTFTFPCQRHLLPERLFCSSQRDYFANTIYYEYDANTLVRLIDSFQRQLHFIYDVHGRLLEIRLASSNPAFHGWTFVRYEYDLRGDLVAVFDANGIPLRYEYAAHLLTRVTDRAGREVYYCYDRQRRCVRTWFAGGVWDRQLRYDP